MDFSNQLILKDFDTFVDILNQQGSLELTNAKALLKSKDLFVFNQKMRSFQSQFLSEKHKQDVYTLLNTLYSIAEKAELVVKKTDPKSQKNTLHLNVERARLYDNLSENEKYFFLLDTFWSHLNWRKVYDCSGFWNSDFYLKLAQNYPTNKKIKLVDGKKNGVQKGELNYRAGDSNFILEMMAAFGFLELEWDTNLTKKPDKYTLSYQSVRLTPLGKLFLPILFSNLGNNLRRGMFFMDLDLLFSDKKKKNASKEKQIEVKNLSGLMKHHFPNWDIENKLLPIGYELISGVYRFKVWLDKKCYRVIEIGGNDTYDTLHHAIQNAFGFGNDHLYAFHMDNDPQCRDEDYIYWGPYCEDGKYYAEELLIGETGLIAGKAFIYFFDFGACWTFHVQLINIQPTSEEHEPRAARIIETVGKAPEQYPDWEDE